MLFRARGARWVDERLDSGSRPAAYARALELRLSTSTLPVRKWKPWEIRRGKIRRKMSSVGRASGNFGVDHPKFQPGTFVPGSRFANRASFDANRAMCPVCPVLEWPLRGRGGRRRSRGRSGRSWIMSYVAYDREAEIHPPALFCDELAGAFLQWFVTYLSVMLLTFCAVLTMKTWKERCHDHRRVIYINFTSLVVCLFHWETTHRVLKIFPGCATNEEKKIRSMKGRGEVVCARGEIWCTGAASNGGA